MHPTSPRTSARTPELDGLRGLAALAVIVFHLALRAPVLYDAAAPVTGHLDLGVDIFFVLSGFLIWRPFAAALTARSPLPGIGRYALRRSARIWPAYLLALITVVVVGATTISGPGAFLKHATLSYTYFEHRGGDGIRVAWTLVVELSFYLFVPVLALALTRLGPRARSLAPPVVLIAVGAVFQWLVAMNLDTWPAIRILPPALLTLGLGMLFAAVTHDESRAAAFVQRVADRPARCYAAALGCFVALVVLVPYESGPISSRPADRVTQAFLQAAIAGLLILPIAVGSRSESRIRAFLGLPVVIYVGLISFGLYLWHIPMLHLFRDLVRDRSPSTAIVGWTIALTATVAMAALSWHFLEKPILRRLPQRRRAPTVSTASEPSPEAIATDAGHSRATSGN